VPNGGHDRQATLLAPRLPGCFSPSKSSPTLLARSLSDPDVVAHQ
jgi:hypothetical protein